MSKIYDYTTMLFLDFTHSELSCFLATKEMFYFLICGVMIGDQLRSDTCAALSSYTYDETTYTNPSDG